MKQFREQKDEAKRFGRLQDERVRRLTELRIALRRRALRSLCALRHPDALRRPRPSSTTSSGSSGTSRRRSRRGRSRSSSAPTGSRVCGPSRCARNSMRSADPRQTSHDASVKAARKEQLKAQKEASKQDKQIKERQKDLDAQVRAVVCWIHVVVRWLTTARTASGPARDPDQARARGEEAAEGRDDADDDAERAGSAPRVGREAAQGPARRREAVAARAGYVIAALGVG